MHRVNLVLTWLACSGSARHNCSKAGLAYKLQIRNKHAVRNPLVQLAQLFLTVENPVGWQIIGHQNPDAKFARSNSGSQLRSRQHSGLPLRRVQIALQLEEESANQVNRATPETSQPWDFQKSRRRLKAAQPELVFRRDEPKKSIYILDGQGIAGFSNQITQPPQPSQLIAACSHYTDLGHEVLLFVPSLPEGTDTKEIQRIIGEDRIVSTPVGSSVSAFMIQVAKQYQNKTGSIIKMVTNVISNRTFPELSEDWLKGTIVKFTFVVRTFLPEERHIRAFPDNEIEEASKEKVCVLDGQDIVSSSNQLEEVGWNVEQLMAAGSYYKSRGYLVLVFLPYLAYYYLHDQASLQLEELSEEFGEDYLVTVPGDSATVFKFMINFVETYKKRYRVSLVTNYRFEASTASLGLTASWVRDHIVKYIFAIRGFIPQHVRDRSAALQQQSIGRDMRIGASETTKRQMYLLDGQNILSHSNQLKNWPFWDWGLLIAAGSYYKSRGHQVLVFLPYDRLKDARKRYFAEFESLQDLFGPDGIVMTPRGCSHTIFMINYVNENVEDHMALLVTNNLFQDWGLSDEWLKQYTVPFAFAGNSFIPGAHSNLQSFAELSDTVVALDGLSLVTHQIQNETLNWQQLTSAASFYKECGCKVLFFFQRSDLEKTYGIDEDLKSLRAQFGTECIVMTPDDIQLTAFLVNYVKDYPNDRDIHMVTNHQFTNPLEEFGVSETWVKDLRIRFTFAGEAFVPRDAKELLHEVFRSRAQALGLEDQRTLWAQNSLFNILAHTQDVDGVADLRREIAKFERKSSSSVKLKIPSPDELSKLFVNPEANTLTTQAKQEPLETYEDAEAFGEQYFLAGKYDMAIRMFELAQTLPSASWGEAPPGELPEWPEESVMREQVLKARYNVACCCVALGNSDRAMILLREYVENAGGDPLDHIREMLADGDLAELQDALLALGAEFKSPQKLFGIDWR